MFWTEFIYLVQLETHKLGLSLNHDPIEIDFIDLEIVDQSNTVKVQIIKPDGQHKRPRLRVQGL